MLTAIATLVFTATLWLVFVLLAGMLKESGPRIVAAAQAQALGNGARPSNLRVTPLAGARVRLPSPVLPVWRAAA